MSDVIENICKRGRECVGEREIICGREGENVWARETELGSVRECVGERENVWARARAR